MMDDEPLMLKIETLKNVVTSLGHNSLWFRIINYGASYPALEFIVTCGNRRLAQWSVLHGALTVTDALLCIPLNGSLTHPPGVPVNDEWMFFRIHYEPLSRKAL
ncbi:hypothetical protein [Klebsiella pneumoniae]|uniref:hypothetical protein n=1 Tax=Klebsiella pneumoniae TaxID=573 RepID=UPI00115A494C|nr:hypothetical protein [Klebsiella pneumoniae]